MAQTLTRTTEGPDERAEFQQRSREGCRRHPSFLRRSLRCEGLTRGRVSGGDAHLRLTPALVPQRHRASASRQAVSAPERLQLQLQATGEPRSGPEKRPHTHDWPHPKGTSAAVLLPWERSGAVSALVLRPSFPSQKTSC